MKPSTWIILLCFLLCFSSLWQLGSWGVTESSEARYAEIAREMLENGQWTFPQYLQILHFDKPLMTYWITALGMKLWGVDAFGARFFLQVAFIAQVLVLAKLAYELFDSTKLALYCAVMYSGIPLVLISVRNLTTDAYLNTFALLASLFYVLHYKRKGLGWLYLFFISLGLAIFTKGPFGVLLPLLSMYPIGKIIGDKARPRKQNLVHYFIGTFITLLIGGWWFITLMNRSAEFYDFFIGEQLIHRVSDAGSMKRSEPFWYYLALLPLFVLPIVGLFVGSFRYLRKGEKGLKALLVFTVLIPLVLFSVASSKLVLYILPIIPYLVLLSGHFLFSLDAERTKGHWQFTLGLYCLITVALVCFSFDLVPGMVYRANGFQFVLLVMLIGYQGYVIFNVPNRKTKMLLFYLILPLFVLPFSTHVMKVLALQINSTRPITDFIQDKGLEKEPIIVWNRALNSIPFELQKNIYSIRYTHYSLDRRTQFQPDRGWKTYLMDIHQLEGVSAIKQLIHASAVLIRQERDSIPRQFSWLPEAFSKQERIGKWIIYYD